MSLGGKLYLCWVRLWLCVASRLSFLASWSKRYNLLAESIWPHIWSLFLVRLVFPSAICGICGLQESSVLACFEHLTAEIDFIYAWRFRCHRRGHKNRPLTSFLFPAGSEGNSRSHVANFHRIWGLEIILKPGFIEQSLTRPFLEDIPMTALPFLILLPISFSENCYGLSEGEKDKSL